MQNVGYGRAMAVTLMLCLAAFRADGKKLYRYQDGNGQWAYTDRPPAAVTAGQEVAVRQLDVKPRQLVRLFQSGDPQQPDYSIINEYAGPAEVLFTFSAKDNVRAYPDLPARFVLASGLSEKLVKISILNPRLPWRFSVNYQFVPGKPLPDYRSSYPYLPPFAPGRSFTVTQGFNGGFTHTETHNRYAADIAMPVGTPVHAAREGVVISVENDFYKNGLEEKYRPESNCILILHDDGSMAVYAHLELEKALVTPGTAVKAGQLIAYSGNTGFSSGPHLHFSVQYNRGMELVSVPFEFRGADGQTFAPSVGQAVTAF